MMLLRGNYVKEPGVGDGDSAVDRRYEEVDIGMVRGAVVGRDRNRRLVILAIPVTVQGVFEPRYRGAQPAWHPDPHGVGGDRQEAPQLHRTREERGTVLLFPQVVRLALGGVLHEVQVGGD